MQRIFVILFVNFAGLTRPGYGEGVYIGQDWSKWTSPNDPDKCDRNIVRNNRIGPCAAENIDIKEGSCCGIIEGNTFDGTAMSNVNSDDSWIDIKGNDYLVVNNTGFYSIKVIYCRSSPVVCLFLHDLATFYSCFPSYCLMNRLENVAKLCKNRHNSGSGSIFYE